MPKNSTIENLDVNTSSSEVSSFYHDYHKISFRYSILTNNKHGRRCDNTKIRYIDKPAKICNNTASYLFDIIPTQASHKIENMREVRNQVVLKRT